ncbi:hypothetical protein SAMN05880590_1381, partial [Rhizobium sp. RU35A]
SGSYAGGDVTLSGQSISLTNATIAGKNVNLTAKDEKADSVAFIIQTGSSSSNVSITKGSLIKADGTLNVSATASSVVEDLTLNVNRPYLLSSANTASASVTIDASSLTAKGDVNVEATAKTVSLASDLLTDSILPIPIPFDAAVGVALSSAKVNVVNGSSLTSETASIGLIADSRAEIEAIATARNITLGKGSLPYAAAVSVGVLTNDAEVIVDSSSLDARNNVEVHAYALSENTTSFDVLGGGSTNGALGAGFNFNDHKAIAKVRNSGVTARTGGVNVLADSILRADQAGTLNVSDGASDNVLELIGAVVGAVVSEFFTDNGKVNATGEKINKYWGITESAASGIDKLASLYSAAWGKKSGITGKRDEDSGLWGATGGVLVALDESSAEISSDPLKAVTIDSAGALRVESRSNALTRNFVESAIKYKGTGGTATALAVNLSYEDISNTASVGSDTNSGKLSVNAASASVRASEFETTALSKDESVLTFRNQQMDADRYQNGRAIIANARAEATKAAANTYGIGIGISTRDTQANLDNVALKLSGIGALSVVAENRLSILYLEAGDAAEAAAVGTKAAMSRLNGELGQIRDAKVAAKAEAEEKKRLAVSAVEKAEADKEIAEAEDDIKKAEAQKALVGAVNGAVQDAASEAVASIGSTYTIGFNLITQDTAARIGSGAQVGSVALGGLLSGAVGDISVLAHSSMEGGLSTFATVNGGSADKASTGQALNIGAHVLLGETVANIATRAGASGKDAANTLWSTGDVSVSARNETGFSITNTSSTPDKMTGDATAASLITVSGGVQMLDTSAQLGRSVFAQGTLAVEAASANTVGTYLAASTAGGGAVAPVTTAITNGLELLSNLADLKDSGSSDDDNDAKNATLGISAIMSLGVVGNALANSSSMKTNSEKALAAEKNAQKVMKDQAKSDFVLSGAFSFNSFDSVAETLPGLTLSADGIRVGAYNVTDAKVDITATSKFSQGAGAKVLSAAVNLANQDNLALIGSGSTVVAGKKGLAVDASTKAWKEDDKGNETLSTASSDFLSRSVGKATIGGDQLIVSLGLNIVDFENEARIDNNVTILSQAAYAASTQAAMNAAVSANGDKPDVTVNSLASITLKAEGNAAAGVNGMFFATEDGLLKYYETTKKARGAALGVTIAQMATPLFGEYLDARVRQRQAELTKTPTAGGSGSAKGFGVGINVGSIDVKANILAGNAVVDAGALSVTGEARVRSSALGVAGSGPSNEILSLSAKATKTAATAADAAAAINVVYGDVSAAVGKGRAATVREATPAKGLDALTSDGTILAKSVTVGAKTQAMAEATADGKAAGTQAADGDAGALNLHDFDTTATLSASARATGDVAVTATADTMEVVNAQASARGTPVEDYAAKLKTSINSLLLGSGGGNANTGIFGRAADRFATTYKEISKATEKTQDAKPSQAFAAAVGFNFSDHDTKAIVADGVKIETGGAINVIADHDAMSMAEVSGAAVLSDAATGAAISINVINTTSAAVVGNDVTFGSSERKATDVTVEAMSRFNTGVNVADLLRYKTDAKGNYVLVNGNKVLDETVPNFAYAAEAIAGAGGKGSSFTGAFATTVYLGDTSTTLGNRVSINATGDATIAAYDQSKVANKAWGVSAALGTGTSTTKSARGAVGSVIYRGREVATTIGTDLDLRTGKDADIVARVLAPSDAWVGPEKGSLVSSTTWRDYVDPVLGGDIAAPLRNADPAVTQSLHNQVIAAAAAGQSTEASYSGALGITIANGVTKVDVGDRAHVEAKAINVESRMNQEVLGVGGSLTVSLSGAGGTFGAQGAVNVVMDEVLTSVGKGGVFVANGGAADFTSEAETQAMSITAVASLSGSTSTTVAANISSNTFQSSAKTAIADNVSITAANDANITAKNAIDAFAFAGALGVTFGTKNPVAGTLVSNVQLSSAESLLGSAVTVTSVGGSVNLGADTSERLLSIPVAGGGDAGVLSVTVVDSTTRAVADKTSTLTASNGNVSVKAQNQSDVLEIAGSVAFSMSGAAFGLTMPGTGVNKTVEAQIGNASARNIEIAARASNDIRQLAGAGGASTKSTGVGGTVAVLVLDNDVTARIAEGATVTANGNVWLDAADDSSLLQFGGGIGAGKEVGVGASVGALVVLGHTLAEVGSKASVTARGLEGNVITFEELQEVEEAKEAQRTGIVESFNGLKDTGLAFADDVEAAFDTLGNIGQSKAKRDALLDMPTTTRTAKGFVMTANGDHRAVAISLAVG